MTFDDIPSGSIVYLDANVFVYHYGPDPNFGPPSRRLLERVESGDVEGVCSTHDMANVAHRLMTLEACQTFGWPYAGILQKLRSHPAEVRKLYRFRQAIEEISMIGVRILAVLATDIVRGTEMTSQHGLLCGDALIVSLMNANDITAIASNDADFDRIPTLTRYSPL